MSYNYDENNVVMAFQTVRINAIRTLFSCMKELLVSGNIVFNKDGFHIMEMDNSLIILLHLFMDANKFEYYVCKKDKIMIGLKFEHFYKCINSFDSEKTLTICIENEDYSNGFVSHLTLIGEGNGKVRIKKIQLGEPGEQEYEYPEVFYPKMRTFSSSEFTKIVKHMSDVSKTLEIKCVGNELFFTGKGTMSSELDHRTPNKIIKHDDDNSEDMTTIVHGVFSLKYLSLFSRCKELCSQLELYLDNDAPLTIKYDVFNMGILRLSLNPTTLDN
jgi:proliferating cell nuclear antigen